LTYDIAGDIMDQAKIDAWRSELSSLRGRLGNIKYDEMIDFAKSLGRTQVPGSSPPVYACHARLNNRSLSIHYHPRAMKKGTARQALKILEVDIEGWERLLDEGHG
jgi:hypothetical protein